MARNSSGTYTLPAGNPVVSATTISTTWANTTLGDLATEITDSASRSGKGGFTAPVRAPDGTVAAPAVAFTSEPASGIYKAGTGDVRFALGGVDFILKTGITFPATSATVAVSGADAQLVLKGNRNAASTTTDVAIVSNVTRTAGIILQIFNSIARLNIDYQGLLRLDPGAVAAAIQPASLWTAITPNAGWTANNGLAYWKDANGMVHLKGYVTGAATNPAFTLPVGFRPAALRWYPATNTNSPTFVSVDTTGAVSCITSGGLSTSSYLDSIIFLAEQ